jgi:uncharacterized protein (UPF0261 family)
MLIAPAEPDAQKDRDEDHDDNGDDADYEQDHRTTQQAMASAGDASKAHAAMARAFPRVRLAAWIIQDRTLDQ